MTTDKLLPESTRRWHVTPEEADCRLIDLLCARDASQSASFWRKQIDEQRVWIEGQPARIATRTLKVGCVVLSATQSPSDEWSVLDRCEGLVVLYKPHGALFDDVKRHLKALGLTVTYPVHRLDKMTSGLMLAAEDATLLPAIEASFKQREVKKSYLAVVWGKPKENQGVIDLSLVKKSSMHGGAHVQEAQVGDEEALSAATSWKLLAHRAGLSLLECEPQSGRTHQVRIHLQSIGHPIVGDRDYQTPRPPKSWWGNLLVCQHMLHASTLEMTWAGELRKWHAPLSPDFERLCRWINEPTLAASSEPSALVSSIEEK